MAAKGLAKQKGQSLKTSNSMSDFKVANSAIASKLLEYAELLEQQGADGFREQAYRNAADAIGGFRVSLEDILKKEGRSGLIALPTIGRGIAAAISEMIVTGRWSQLERLRGEMIPEKLFQTIPGIGPKLADRLAHEGHLETLEDLRGGHS